MELKLNDPIAVMLVHRLQREIGELYVQNCFLEEHCDAFKNTLLEQNNELLVLKDKLTACDNKIQELQNVININQYTKHPKRRKTFKTEDINIQEH